MSDIARNVGRRLRNFRTDKGLSQEKLAELSGCHPAYIGQLERGEKNPTLDSLYKITSALGIPLSELFAGIDWNITAKESAASQCHEYIESKSPREQKNLLNILRELDNYSAK